MPRFFALQNDRQALAPFLAIALCSLAWPSMANDARLQGNPLDAIPPNPQPTTPAPPTATPAPAPPHPQQALLNRTVVPQYFDVTGVQALDFAPIAATLEPLAGQAMTVAELAQKIDAITTHYRDQGYLLSFALLQNQDFADGLVRVTVVEGHVGSTRIEGDAGTATPRLEALARQIEAERPLRRATLERYLNLMAGIPGLRVRPELALPHRADGATELVLHVESRQAFALNASLADLGMGLQVLASARVQSLTPLGEQIQVTSTLPRGHADVEYYQGAVTVPVGSDGLTVQLDASKYRSTPEDAQLTLLGLQRAVRTERAQLTLQYPVWLSNSEALYVRGGFSASRHVDRYTRLDQRASVALHTDLRVFHAGVRYATASARQSRSIDLSVHRGVDGMGARQHESLPYRLDFTRFNLQLQQNLTLPANLGVALSATGQYSPHTLASSERISFGAWRFGLGYPAGELAGDSGYGLAAELNYTWRPGRVWLNTVQPYARVDHARVFYRNDAESALNADRRKLSSVALGIRLSGQRHYAFDFNIAKPVGDTPINRGRRSLQFNANYSVRYD